MHSYISKYIPVSHVGARVQGFAPAATDSERVAGRDSAQVCMLIVCVCSVWVPCVALPSGGGSSVGPSPLCGSPMWVPCVGPLSLCTTFLHGEY